MSDLHFYSSDYLGAAVMLHGSGLLDDYAPAKIEDRDGGTVYDRAHPAFVAAREKYHTKLRGIRGGKEDPAVAAERKARVSARGRALWHELHTKRDADQVWLDAWLARVPCGVCRGSARAWIAANPPAFGEGWFEWAHRFHESVNAKLGKPAVTLEDARKIWS